ncbi:MAG: hypothetical protein EXR86_05145 [Gammaproteobacteria bacterium]|nr:hypothetical protein [Gammaproteobacteria bacterium]
MTEDELLQRIAQTLKQEIGPAIDAEYPKTQAFMAGVVLQKLSRQLGVAARHQAAERADLDALLADLNHTARDLPLPAEMQTSLERLTRDRNKAAVCGLIEALYSSRNALGAEHFTVLLARVRQTLRANIDRQVEYAA